MALLILKADRREVLLRLECLKGKKGRGQTIMSDVVVGGVELKKGDRLDPSPTLPDTHGFRRAQLPLEITFWRARYDASKRLDGPAVHKNPLFDSSLGYSPKSMMVVDALHSVYYGPLMRFTSAVVWRILLRNTWAFAGGVDQVKEGNLRMLHAHLGRFDVAHDIPQDRRVTDLTLNMLGSDEKCGVRGVRQHPGGIVKVKAAECGVLFEWACTLLEERGRDLPMFANLAAAGKAMSRWLELTRMSGDIMSDAVCAELTACCQRYSAHSARALVAFTPKKICFAEFTLQASHHGNPKRYATWVDEGLNSRLRNAASAAHRTRQAERVFQWLRLQGSLGLAPSIFGGKQIQVV